MQQTLIISGAGPIGLLCALKLAQNDINTMVLDPILSKNSPWNNQRTIALSYGSMQLLKQVNIDLSSLASKIKNVNISIFNKFGACDMFANDYNADALGYVIKYSDLCHALYKACLNSYNICFVAKKLLNYEYNQFTDLVDGYVDGGAVYSSKLLIISEGNQNTEKKQTQNIEKTNQQYAHVGWINFCNLPKKYINTAFERFTNQGPIALLPYNHISENGVKYNYAIVWCSHSKDDSLCSIDNLYNLFGWRCGEISQLKIEQHFNLKQQVRDILHENNVVYIGNSAQSLHPVAGQGLNLGFRQIHNLVDSILKNKPLTQFVTDIQNDRISMIYTTSIMSNIFTLPIPTLKQKLAFALQVVDIFPSIKKQFAQHFMYGYR